MVVGLIGKFENPSYNKKSCYLFFVFARPGPEFVDWVGTSQYWKCKLPHSSSTHPLIFLPLYKSNTSTFKLLFKHLNPHSSTEVVSQETIPSQTRTLKTL